MLAFTATLGIGLLALVLWYLTRSKQRRVWLPLLAVLRVPRRVLPRLTWQRPSLLALLCFFGIWLALLAYTTSPSYTSVTETAKYRLYVYIDFSASVSGRINIKAYREFLQAQWQDWQAAVVSVETSHNEEVYTFSSAAEFAAHVSRLDFHRHATHIAAALQQRGEQLRDYDRVIIVSDYDAYSWRNIHWQQTLEHLPVPRQRTATTNFYLQSVDRQAQGIDITVARSGVVRAAKFTLQISAENNSKVIVHGEMKANQSKTYLRSDYLPFASKYRAQLLGIDADAIALDNTYLFTGKASQQKALIIADLYGERAIDDPLYQLHTALDVLGMQVIRQDHARAVEHDLLVLAYDRNFNAQEHCLMSNKKIWLMPQTLGTDSFEACRCFFRLIGSQGTCVGKSWQEVLQTSGAKRSKLWWHKDRVIVFAAPLYTYQAAQLPVIIKHLLAADGLLDQRLTADQHVPRGESLMQERELPVRDDNVVIGNRREHVWAQALVWYVLVISLIELLLAHSINFNR